jgi:UDP-4-amino-4,6-dideoxy-N-acetyl-beta-L-altrosamine N-acetyltransferase
MNIEFVNILDVDENLIEQVRRWRNSESVSKYMFTNHYITKEEHKKWMEKLKKESTAKAWVIIYQRKCCWISLFIGY